MKKIYLSFIITISFSSIAAPIRDNILFAFDKCKELSVDLEKGHLKESLNSSFDLVCKKNNKTVQDFECEYFETGSQTILNSEFFSGESDLGVAELKSKTGKKLKFLIGKSFATFESPNEFKVCAGIFLFEQDALKKKTLR